jgi:hypothetical protein
MGGGSYMCHYSDGGMRVLGSSNLILATGNQLGFTYNISCANATLNDFHDIIFGYGAV